MEQKQYEVLCGFMDHLTKGYNWYYDTPERRFEWTPGSVWLINPETKQWVLRLEKEGKLWWYVGFYRNFQRYFNMGMSDYENFIKVWMEDVLNRGVSSTRPGSRLEHELVMHILYRGGDSRYSVSDMEGMAVEDVLNRGIYIKDCMGVDGGIKNNCLYLMEKSFYDDFKNKVDKRVIERIFNTR